ncbi:hypothetical protein Tco_0489347 [Tanacetum coccineum]
MKMMICYGQGDQFEDYIEPLEILPQLSDYADFASSLYNMLPILMFIIVLRLEKSCRCDGSETVNCIRLEEDYDLWVSNLLIPCMSVSKLS